SRSSVLLGSRWWCRAPCGSCSRWSQGPPTPCCWCCWCCLLWRVQRGAPGPRASPHPGRVVCGSSSGYGVWFRLRCRGLDKLDRRLVGGGLLHPEQRDLVLEVAGRAERLVDAGEPQVGDRVERAERPE